MLSTYLLQETISKVFNKILSRWQKLWSRWREKKLVTKVQLILWAPKAQVSGKIVKSGPLRNIMLLQHSGTKVRVSEQNTDIIKLFGFFIQWQHMNIVPPLKSKLPPSRESCRALHDSNCWGNFQRKVSGEWNSWQILPATGSYWKPCMCC